MIGEEVENVVICPNWHANSFGIVDVEYDETKVRFTTYRCHDCGATFKVKRVDGVIVENGNTAKEQKKIW